MLSRSLTLIESTKKEDRKKAQEILDGCLPHHGRSIRVGITGSPGVGKSTFIEAMGNYIIDQGKKLAVLTVDPSSSKSKGSILGDKTRMKTLAANDDAFIRPSPSAGTLGGVARKTHEMILICEAAGYDTIFIETVGVGQSETAVHAMVDFFLLLLLPDAGDELQGMKRGIIEMADLIAINKTDISTKQQVRQTRLAFKRALRLNTDKESEWKPGVVNCSGLKEQGISKIWGLIEEYVSTVKENGFFETNRKRQAIHWMLETVNQRLKDDFYHHPDVQKRLATVKDKILNGKISAAEGAELLLKVYKQK